MWFGLLLFSLTKAELNLVPERLKVDGVFVGYGVLYQGVTKGWSKPGFNFQWRLGTLGLTGNISENATMRIEFDFCHLFLRDLFIDFKLPGGFGVRAGQFPLPLSFEVETQERDLKLEEYSIIYWNMGKPNTVRDIGFLFSWGQPDSLQSFRAIAAVVQGTGPNTIDNNYQKDLFARAVVTAWSKMNLTFGVRGYYGWVNPEAVRWLGAGVEASFQPGATNVTTELAIRRHQNISVPAGLIEISHQLSFLEPAGRFEVMRLDDGKLQWRILTGLMIKPTTENLKVFFGYQYSTLITVWSYQHLIVQLIAGF
ncbi:MAG: porin [bacterium]